MTKKNKASKINHKRQDYLLSILDRSKNGNLQQEKVIEESDYNSLIAKGCKEYKLYILNQILDGRKYTEEDFRRFSSYKEEVKNSFLNYFQPNSTYKEILGFPKNIGFKYFGIKNLEEYCLMFNIDLNKLKIQYDNYISSLKEIPLILESINEFLNNKSNINKFQKETKLQLNLHNFLMSVDTPKEKILQILEESEIAYKKEQELKRKKQEEEYQKLLQHQLELKKIEEEKKKKEKQQRLDTHLHYLNSFKNNPKTNYEDILSLLQNKDTKIVLNNKNLTDNELIAYLEVNLQKEKQKYLEEEKKCQEILGKYFWGNSKLIHNKDIEKILQITPTEFKKWKSDGRLKVQESRQFEKWGKTLFSDFFDPRFILSITPEIIQNWRITDKLQNGKNIKIKSDKINNFVDLIKLTAEKKFLYNKEDWYFLENFEIYGHIIKNIVKIEPKINYEEDLTFRKLINRLNKEKELINLNDEKNKLIKKIDNYQLDESVRDRMLSHLSNHTKLIKIADFNKNTLIKTIENHLEIFLKLRERGNIIKSLKINEYESGFPIARQIQRNIKIIVGPTNSGKTYEAIKHLMECESGVYLAPLRLLAMEIYDKLNSEGVPCNLITGEEKIIIPGAKHTASTIEMVNTNEVVDIAVIDEFQMLTDPQRGWAWTNAMVGVPAKTVYVIGNEQKLEATTKLYSHLNEPYQIIKKERFNELQVVSNLIAIENLQKGDAIIAFSRKDVLSYATLLRENKYKVSVIYGSLSPEVRRRQAAMFNSGQTDILISTDAIGMGLNLPIRRIIFATIKKFDGEMVRELNVSEFLQIAGRAGRFGLHENGFVGALKNKVNDQNTVNLIKKTIQSKAYGENSYLIVAPSHWHIDIISKTLKTKDLKKILMYFSSLDYSFLFECANLEHMCELYEKIKKEIKRFSLIEQYKLLTAPIEINNDQIINYYSSLIQAINQNEKMNFEISEVFDLEDAELESKKITLFAWLSFHYNIFNYESIIEERENIATYIQKALVNTRLYNFSNMIEPKSFNESFW